MTRPSRLDPAGLLDEALVRAVHRAGAACGGIYLLDEQEQVLSLAVMCGVPKEVTEPWWRVPVARRGPPSTAVREDRLVWVGSQEDMARLSPASAAALPHRMAVATVPIRGAHRCWGALNLVWAARRSPQLSRRERAQVLFGARDVARVLDTAVHLPDPPETPRVVPVHPGAARPGQPALAAADLVERLPAGALALDREGHVTFVDNAAVELLGRTPGQLLGSVLWETVPWLWNASCAESYRAAWLGGAPAALGVVRPPDRPLNLRLYPDAGGISVLITPGRAAEQHPQPHDANTPGPASAVSAAAAGRIHQLMHLAASLTETVGVQDVVDLIAELIMPTFGADSMVVSTAEAGRLKAIGHRGYDPDVIERLEGLPVDADLTPVGRALATGIPSFFADRPELARSHPESPLSDNQAWAFLPLIASGRPVGCCVLAYSRPHVFTVDERATLIPLASLIAQALDRALLYDAKHTLNHALQQRLLPRALPGVNGLNVAARYLPASFGMDIGGDFYDLIRLTDTTVAAVIGDVQGHDVTAAALMGQVRTAIHSHATAGASPDKVLTQTNRDLADLDPGRFITCLYAHLDLARQQVTIASAGHPPPLLYHPDRHVRVVDVDPGPPLGIGIEVPQPLTTLPLPTGAILTLYTDGLVETPGADIGQTTDDLARHLARSSDLPLHHMIDSLVQHACPTGQRTDDIALLLLQPTT
ncbi:SpoIIE family protein phosphatase [Streptomyces sp. NPDC037389]|uniref:SpoIIE family protein phosphatase n=1 Tax=Streptomyces sp. NPDC037389 TaxID=3155369 RepID=UPI0033C5E91D